MSKENTNPITSIAYGVISIGDIHHDVVEQLYFNETAVNVTYLVEFLLPYNKEHLNIAMDFTGTKSVKEVLEKISALEDYYEYSEEFATAKEEWFEFSFERDWLVEGVYEGVEYEIVPNNYSSSTLFVKNSPLTGLFYKCSPCAPNAGSLAEPSTEGEPNTVEAYTIPADWNWDSY